MWSEYKREIDIRRDIIFSLAEDYKAIPVAMQGVFEQACQQRPPEYWLWDGIHPTPAGHQLIACEWFKAVEGDLYADPI